MNNIYSSMLDAFMPYIIGTIGGLFVLLVTGLVIYAELRSIHKDLNRK